MIFYSAHFRKFAEIAASHFTFLTCSSVISDEGVAQRSSSYKSPATLSFLLNLVFVSLLISLGRLLWSIQLMLALCQLHTATVQSCVCVSVVVVIFVVILIVIVVVHFPLSFCVYRQGMRDS